MFATERAAEAASSITEGLSTRVTIEFETTIVTSSVTAAAGRMRRTRRA